MELRLREKRNLVKTMVGELSRFYAVDAARVLQHLDELGNLNRVRRTIVHGFIRWSSDKQQAVFLDGWRCRLRVAGRAILHQPNSS